MLDEPVDVVSVRRRLLVDGSLTRENWSSVITRAGPRVVGARCRRGGPGLPSPTSHRAVVRVVVVVAEGADSRGWSCGAIVRLGVLAQ